jgi:hypothetical protein
MWGDILTRLSLSMNVILILIFKFLFGYVVTTFPSNLNPSHVAAHFCLTSASTYSAAVMAQVCALAPFPRLPNELICRILNFAAASSKDFCLSMCLVSSWARHLALKHLLSTIVITSHEKAMNFEAYLRSLRRLHCPNRDPASLIRGLWVEESTFNGFWDGILDTFTNLTHLAITGEELSRNLTQPAIQVLYPKSNGTPSESRDFDLTILNAFYFLSQQYRYSSLKNTPSTIPLFQNVTHVVLSRCYSYTLIATALQPFHRLTHLAVPFCADFPHLRLGHLQEKVLANISLQVLVIALCACDEGVCSVGRNDAKHWVKKVRRVDGRITCVVGKTASLAHWRKNGDAWKTDWKADMVTGESFWEQAARYTGELDKIDSVDQYMYVMPFDSAALAPTDRIAVSPHAEPCRPQQQFEEEPQKIIHWRTL